MECKQCIDKLDEAAVEIKCLSFTKEKDPVQYALYHTWRRREDAKQDEMQILQISKELRERP